jgi:GTP:adenosylcobinamide-phosphate guanylyltransferase
MKLSHCNDCESPVKLYSDFGKSGEMVYYCADCDKELTYNFKFCILAAGKGTRNNNVQGLHKALLPLENKPVISHIIDRLDKKIEIVIAVGYKSEQIKSYLNEVYNDRNITYVDVDNYDGKGSGPGYSLLSCKTELQTPFIFTSVDTLVGEDIAFKYVGNNWLGVSEVDIEDSMNYCLVRGTKYLDSLFYGTGNRAYVGMAGICDYKEFWKSLEDQKIVNDEYQVIHGFDGLDKIRLIDFTWYDTGNNKSYEETRKVFKNEVVANKSDEVLFIDNDKVIKYFDNKNKILLRQQRVKYLNGTCPNVYEINENMYAYDYINGEMLSNIADEKILRKFLDWCQENLFIEKESNTNFEDDCFEMYTTKTNQRVDKLVGSELDRIQIINGVDVEPIQQMLSKIDWKLLCDNSVPSSFHGDLQPENIIYNETNKQFTLIDWRQSFGNSIEVGDVYYDLGKLYHAIMINGQTILKDMFDFKRTGFSVELNFYAKNNLVEFMKIFENFCKENQYDWKRVQLIGILQYFNICTLYDNFKGGKYGDFLFLYGKYLLAKYQRDSDEQK